MRHPTRILLIAALALAAEIGAVFLAEYLNHGALILGHETGTRILQRDLQGSIK